VKKSKTAVREIEPQEKPQKWEAASLVVLFSHRLKKRLSVMAAAGNCDFGNHENNTGRGRAEVSAE